MLAVASRRGYRSGGFNLRPTSLADIGPFAPETVTDIEIGAKRAWDLGGETRLVTNVAGYFQWYKDIQRNVQVLSGTNLLTLIKNAASAHVSGGEAEVELQHGRLLRVNLNYAYNHFEYVSYPLLAQVNGVPGQPTSYADRVPSYNPKHQINASVTLSPEIGDFADLDMTLSMSYQSKVALNEEYQTRAQLLAALSPAAKALVPPNQKLVEGGYALVSGRVELSNIDGSRVSAAIWAKNLFDKRYVQFSNVFYPNLDFNNRVYGDPRTFGVEISARF